jgi:hypothetical protein
MAADQAETLKPKRGWYCLTPDRFVAAVLLLDGLLWLSGRYRWFAFNERKGWTVLVAVGAVILAALLILAWFVASLLFRRRFNFPLRSLLVLAVAIAIPCSWLASETQWARKQKEAVTEALGLGGEVVYDYEIDASGNRIPDAELPGPAWLRRFVDDDFFADVAVLWLGSAQVTDAGLVYARNAQVTDAWLEHLKAMRQLQELYLDGTQVTGKGLEYLKGLGQLRVLDLGDTQVTDVGLEHLAGLGQLKKLLLNGTQVTDAGLEHLKGLGHLEELSLDRTQVTGTGLEHLRGLTQLQVLDLKYTPVSDGGLMNLQGLTKLRWLDVGGAKVTEEGVKKLQQALPNCEIER